MYKKYNLGEELYLCVERDGPLGDFELHFHDCYELFYFHRGEGSYNVESSKYVLLPGAMYITNPRELHGPLISSETYYRSTFSFKSALLSSFITKNYNPFYAFEHRKSGISNMIMPHIVKEMGLDKEFEIISNAAKGQARNKELLIKAHAAIMMDKLNQVVDTKSGALAGVERMYEIIQFVNDNLGKPISLSEVAKHFYISQAHLSRLFQERFHMSLAEYIINKRVMWAITMMESSMSLLEVALEVGFSDYSAFYRAFTKIVGTNPRDYRKTI